MTIDKLSEFYGAEASSEDKLLNGFADRIELAEAVMAQVRNQRKAK